MPRCAGSAELLLHTGRVPPWLAERMTELGAVISEAIIRHYSRDELLRRPAHAFWFQSFGAVRGMDRHSSPGYKPPAPAAILPPSNMAAKPTMH